MKTKPARIARREDTVECIDEVGARFRAVRTFAEVLEWCSEMPGHGHVDAHTVGATGGLLMREVGKLEEALDRLKRTLDR